MEIQRLCSDVALVMVERKHGVVSAFGRLVEDGVRRYRAGYAPAVRLRLLDCGTDHVHFLCAEEARLATVWVQGGHRDRGCLDPQLPEEQIAQRKGGEDLLPSDGIGNLSEADVTGEEEDPE